MSEVDYSGQIIFPTWGQGNEIYIKGDIIVYPERTTGLIIGSQTVEPVSFECTTSNTSKVGDCTIKIPDANATLKDLIETDDEITIYYKDLESETPVLLWRGFVQSKDYSIDTAHVLIIKGQEITKILFESYVTKSYKNKEICDIVKEMVSENAPMFDLSGIADSERSISIDFEDTILFDAIQAVLTPFNHRLVVDNEYKIRILYKEDLPISVDEIDIYNIGKVSESDNIFLQYNKVTVQGKEKTITHTEEKITEGRIKELKLIKPEISYKADAEILAKNIINLNAEPKKSYLVNTNLLPHTSAGMRVLLDYPNTTLDGNVFEVRTITHKFTGNIHRSYITIEDDTQFFEELITGMNQGLYKTMLKTFE